MIALFNSELIRELAATGRQLWRSPGFAVSAILTLATGIGVNSAMFGLIDALLLRPPQQVSEPDLVVRLLFATEDPVFGRKTSAQTDYPSVADALSSGGFANVAGYTTTTVSFGRGSDAAEARAMIVTPEFFRVLGVRPFLGVIPVVDATSRIVDNTVVLSYAFWERQFGRDKNVIGKQLVIANTPYTVAAIAPSGLSVLQPRPVDFWLPLNESLRVGFIPNDWRNNRGSFWIQAVARLHPGMVTSLAEQKTSTMLRQRRDQLADASLATAVVVAPLLEGRSDDRPREAKVSLWLASLTTCVLLIACANVSNLFLVRLFARRSEYAIRASLGATTWRLRRHVLGEVFATITLSLVAAVGVEYGCRKLITSFVSNEIPLSRAVFDVRATTVTLGSALVAAVLLSIACLTQLRSTSLSRAPKTAAVADARGGLRTRRVLLACQSALCLVLVFCAGLFAKSLSRVEGLDLGLDLDQTLQVTLNFWSDDRSSADAREAYDRALARLSEYTGVERAAIAERSPYMTGRAVGPWTYERSFAELWSNQPVPFITAVGDGFFSTVGAKSLRGRDFAVTDRMGAPLVAIVNAPLAQRLWPNEDAVGKCVWFDEIQTCARVVGVLGGVWKFNVLERDRLVLYVPIAQSPSIQPGTLFARIRRDAPSALADIRALVQGANPSLPAVSIVRARDLAARDYRPWRLGATLFAVFGLVAMIIATVGLCAVVAFTTSLKLREVGIRRALGAKWPHIAWVVASEGVVAVVFGLVVGTTIALVFAGQMSGVLFRTSPRDITVLGQAVALLFMVAVTAALASVIRALRLSPATALRAD